MTTLKGKAATALACGLMVVAARGAGASRPNQGSPSGGQPAHPPGCYLIWGNRNLIKTCDFLKGGQIMVMWDDIAPQRGMFDWSKVDQGLRFFAEIGRPTTVQVNANRKPEWLWNYVAHRGNTPQYWDPRYLEIQRELIMAFATHLKSSRHRNLVLCVRASYNPIGTEHTWVVREYRRPDSNWSYPPDGHRYPVPWTREERNRYCYAIMRAYMDAFMPEIKVALRANLFTSFYPDGAAHHLLDEGGWIFATGSDIEHQSPHHRTFENMAMLSVDVARTGRTKAYWENWGSVQSHTHGLSWNYWRCLMELHKGVSYVAVKGWAVEAARKNPGYRAAFVFVNRYAGFHADPEHAPGAWCALRQGNHRPLGNYLWFLEQIEPEGTSVALESDRGEKMIGPTDQRFGRFARRTDVGSGRRAMRLRLDPRFRSSVKGRPCGLRVWYLDQGRGAWTVRWGSAAGEAATVEKAGSDRWKEYARTISGSSFRGALPGGGDISLVAEGNEDTTFHMVEIVRPQEGRQGAGFRGIPGRSDQARSGPKRGEYAVTP